MPVQTTYTDARARFAELLDRAGDDRDTVIITRRDHADVAMISADELRSLEETAHLLRSPVNAQRLLEALERSIARDVQPSTLEQLRADVGIDQGLVGSSSP